MKRDFCYCKGVRCAIKQWCVRYLDGIRAMSEEGHWWMDECNENREAYIQSERP